MQKLLLPMHDLWIAVLLLAFLIVSYPQVCGMYAYSVVDVIEGFTSVWHDAQKEALERQTEYMANQVSLPLLKESRAPNASPELVQLEKDGLLDAVTIPCVVHIMGPNLHCTTPCLMHNIHLDTILLDSLDTSTTPGKPATSERQFT